MRVAITGATGFVGPHLARELLAAGDEPVAVSNVEDEVRARHPLRLLRPHPDVAGRARRRRGGGAPRGPLRGRSVVLRAAGVRRGQQRHGHHDVRGTRRCRVEGAGARGQQRRGLRRLPAATDPRVGRDRDELAVRRQQGPRGEPRRLLRQPWSRRRGGSAVQPHRTGAEGRLPAPGPGRRCRGCGGGGPTDAGRGPHHLTRLHRRPGRGPGLPAAARSRPRRPSGSSTSAAGSPGRATSCATWPWPSSA